MIIIGQEISEGFVLCKKISHKLHSLESVQFVALKCFGAEGGTRTPTSFLTTPSRWRVCQFHHFGTWRGRIKKDEDPFNIFQGLRL
jgi:hypothetical protein